MSTSPSVSRLPATPAEIQPGPVADSSEADAAADAKATEQVLAVNATIAEEDLLPCPHQANRKPIGSRSQ